jgi:DNA-binding NarL/FixJ family response regulator
MEQFAPVKRSKDGQPVQYLIVDDSVFARKNLGRIIESFGGQVVGEAGDGLTAISEYDRLKPDIVLMDIQLPGESGIDCVRHLKDVTPGAEIMMLTIFEDHERIFQSLAAGATGYLLKKTPPDKLLEAIRELRAGGAPMSGQIARQVVTAFQRPSPPAARLSPMEQKVLQLLARGHLYKEVADQLEIKISTVRTYVWHIYRKLQVHNRTEAVLKALPMRPV